MGKFVDWSLDNHIIRRIVTDFFVQIHWDHPWWNHSNTIIFLMCKRRIKFCFHWRRMLHFNVICDVLSVRSMAKLCYTPGDTERGISLNPISSSEILKQTINWYLQILHIYAEKMPNLEICMHAICVHTIIYTCIFTLILIWKQYLFSEKHTKLFHVSDNRDNLDCLSLI